MEATIRHETRFEPATELEFLHPESFGWALACCDGDRFQAEEVLQVAYVKVLDGRARFDGRSSFKTWLFGVIRRTAIEQRRSSWLRVARLRRWFFLRQDSPRGSDPEDALHRDESNRVLRRALDRLSRRQREILHLVFYQGLTLDAAAAIAGIAPGSARRHYDRGKERLRALLEPESRR